MIHTSVPFAEFWREEETWRWIWTHRAYLAERGIVQETFELDKDDSAGYDSLIRHLWSSDDLLFFERDMVPASPDSLVELRDCGFEVCAIDYPIARCNLVDTTFPSGLRWLVCAHHLGSYSMMRNLGGDWSDGTWAFCTCPPLGLTRLKKSFMDRTLYPETPMDWRPLDLRMATLLCRAGVKAHIHYPMAKHNHPVPPGQCGHPPLGPEYSGVPVRRIGDVPLEFAYRIGEAHRSNKAHWAIPKVTLD